MTIHEVWYGDSFPAKALRALLWPASLIYSLGWSVYQLWYRLGFKRPYRASCKVVCIGNFTAGGTGKTPTVIFVAKCLQELGYSVVIGCSGYGSPQSVNATVAPMGMLRAPEWGDEPAELRHALPGVPLIVGRARVTAAQLCESEFPDAVLLMDDGFQHMPLAKDLTIVLDPPTPHPLTFPAGPYREPRRSGRRRADLVLPSDDFQVVFSDLVFSGTGGQSAGTPTEARVITAIGRPELFRAALESSGVALAEFSALPDHDELNIDLAKEGGDIPWVVTRKDWVKLSAYTDITKAKVVIANRSATIEPFEAFQKWLKIKLG